MPINVFWDDFEKTIVRAELVDYWTWNDYYRSVAEGARLVQGITQRIDQIVDMRRSHSLPPGVALTHLKRARASDPENPGITVIIGANLMVRVFVAVLERAYGTRFPPRYIVETLDEAHDLISESRIESEMSTT
jgi:hypothetical protein